MCCTWLGLPGKVEVLRGTSTDSDDMDVVSGQRGRKVRTKTRREVSIGRVLGGPSVGLVI